MLWLKLRLDNHKLKWNNKHLNGNFLFDVSVKEQIDLKILIIIRSLFVKFDDNFRAETRVLVNQGENTLVKIVAGCFRDNVEIVILDFKLKSGNDFFKLN